MALVLADRVQETTVTTGTGSITLAGAAAGFQAFSVVGNGNTCYYTIVNGAFWEVGIGTYSTTGPTLARTTVLSSSNAGGLITLSGTSSVFLTYPSEKSVNLDSSGNVGSLGTPSALVGTNITGTAASLSIGGNAATATTATNVSGGTSSVTSETVSGNLTLSGGTANGVAYLNGSKVVTTGSALVFDGTNFVVGGTSILAKSTIVNALSGTAAAFGISDNATTTMYTNNVSAGVSGIWSSGALAFGTNNVTFTEQMRLTSTGLGIGTSSPTQKLTVSAGNIAVYNSSATIAAYGSNSTSPNFSLGNLAGAIHWQLYETLDASGNRGNFNLYDSIASANRLTIDTSGNLGIGTSSPNTNTKLDVAGPIRAQGYTVATLPTGVVGARAYVTNALTPSFGATVVGGGAITIPVFYNGASWIVA